MLGRPRAYVAHTRHVCSHGPYAWLRRCCTRWGERVWRVAFISLFYRKHIVMWVVRGSRSCKKRDISRKHHASNKDVLTQYWPKSVRAHRGWRYNRWSFASPLPLRCTAEAGRGSVHRNGTGVRDEGKAQSRSSQGRRGPTRSLQRATDLLVGLVVTLFLTGGGSSRGDSLINQRQALTADEAIACIRTAVAAQAGLVKEVEGDDEKGQTPPRSEDRGRDGKRHKLYVDVQTNQVVKAK